MTHAEFVEQLAIKLEAAVNRPMQDQPAIDAAIKWAVDVINRSNWTEDDLDGFLRAIQKRLGADDEVDPRTGRRLKRAQSNTAFMALMASADRLAQAVKGGK